MNKDNGSCCDKLECQSLLRRVCCCCNYWEKLHRKDEQSYPHIQYGVLAAHQENNDLLVVEDEDYSPPVQKIFKYPQKYREFSIHPQLGVEGGESDNTMPRNTMPRSNSVFQLKDEVNGRSYARDNKPRSNSAIQLGNEREGSSKVRSNTYLQLRRISDETMKRRFQEINIVPPSPGLRTVQFSLYYYQTESLLMVCVKNARHLPTSQIVESSNPLIQVYLIPTKRNIQQSKCIKRTHNPMFDSIFHFDELDIDLLRKQRLIIRIYINDLKHFIGGILYSLEGANLFGETVFTEISTFNEEDYHKDYLEGDLLISISFVSETDKLRVLVLEANFLKKHHAHRMPNPYLKINVMYREKRILKWKTSIKNSTLTPVFNELCEVDVSGMNRNEIELDILAMDYDRFGHNNEIGYVNFGDNVCYKSGQLIEDVSQWHAILPAPRSKQTLRSSGSKKHTRGGSCPANIVITEEPLPLPI